jgi:hypothetical protein
MMFVIGILFIPAAIVTAPISFFAVLFIRLSRAPRP